MDIKIVDAGDAISPVLSARFARRRDGEDSTGVRRSNARRFRRGGQYACLIAVCLTIGVVPSNAGGQEVTEPSFSCLEKYGTDDVVKGNFYSKFEPGVFAGKTFDARQAYFEYPETESWYMVGLRDGRDSAPADMCWAGGTFTASTSWHDWDISWSESKHGHDNTSTSRGKMENTAGVHAWGNRMTWTGLHVYNMHDAIRTTNSYNNWTVQHVWLDYIRDDCIENDNMYSGLIYDSLFDGCYVALSNQSSTADTSGRLIMMDRVLVRMEPMPYPYKWGERCWYCTYVEGYGEVPFEPGPTFKLIGDNLPEFEITNSVFLHEVPRSGLFPPKENVNACENNTIIWLDGPKTAPMHLLDEFPGCFTIITDPDEGRRVWGDHVENWHRRHPGVGADRKPTNPRAYSWPRFGEAPLFYESPQVTSSEDTVVSEESGDTVVSE